MLTFYKVACIESERGWGQKVDENRYFTTKEEADEFVKNYNKDNTSVSTPDWYMYATAPTTVQIENDLALLIVDSYKKKNKRKKKK
jgi:hypothetical protein